MRLSHSHSIHLKANSPLSASNWKALRNGRGNGGILSGLDNFNSRGRLMFWRLFIPIFLPSPLSELYYRDCRSIVGIHSRDLPNYALYFLSRFSSNLNDTNETKKPKHPETATFPQ